MARRGKFYGVKKQGSLSGGENPALSFKETKKRDAGRQGGTAIKGQ